MNRIIVNTFHVSKFDFHCHPVMCMWVHSVIYFIYLLEKFWFNAIRCESKSIINIKTLKVWHKFSTLFKLNSNQMESNLFLSISSSFHLIVTFRLKQLVASFFLLLFIYVLYKSKITNLKFCIFEELQNTRKHVPTQYTNSMNEPPECLAWIIVNNAKLLHTVPKTISIWILENLYSIRAYSMSMQRS